jgi:hypothetical protein
VTTRRTSVADPVRSRLAARAVVLDVLLVLAFVTVGRRSHGEAEVLAGAAGTAWPFLAGLALGWAGVLAARLDPASPRAGLVLLVATVGAGMLLRRFVADEGTAPAFVVVATAILAVFLVLRRVLARSVARWTAPRP